MTYAVTDDEGRAYVFDVKSFSMFSRHLPPAKNTFFLLGPRATGKTTWIRQNFPDAHRYDLFDNAEAARLRRDAGAFYRECAARPEEAWIVVDEVQREPELLNEVQRLMTDRRQRFVLSGSSARKLNRGGANLLGGRASVRRLLPFTSAELDFARPLPSILAHGMLPLAVERDDPDDFLDAYVGTYLREEIQAESLVRRIANFSRFLEVAGRINAQPVNAAGIARDVGVSRPTVLDYLQILIDTLLATWVTSWRPKRGVAESSHPKLYWFDCGVARRAAGFGRTAVHPEERGFLFETYVLHELRAHLHYGGAGRDVRTWRTRDGAEVDFLVDTDDGVTAIEVKSGDRWDRKFHRGFERFCAQYPDLTVRRIGVFDGPHEQSFDDVRVLPWAAFVRALRKGEICG